MTKRTKAGGLSLTLAAGAALLGVGCDNSQAFHAPDFSLARMQEQPRVNPFDPEMAAPPPFTVARGSLPHAVPAATRATVARGRDHFETLCATCHGIRGNGQSVVATKMLLRPPPSLLDARLRALSDEQISEVIARGYGLMPPFANALPEDERFATVSYVRALQIAQGVSVASLPAPLAADVAREAP